MTFEEAFNSGCRFKLPRGFAGENAWPDGFYWERMSEDTIAYGNGGFEHHDQTLSVHQLKQVGDEDLGSNDWILHPQDEHRVKFNNKLETLINEN